MKKVLITIGVLLFSNVSTAAFLQSGKVEKFNIDTNPAQARFMVYMSGSSGCGPGWYGAYKADMDDTMWKALLSLSLTSYAAGKTISVFSSAASTVCTGNPLKFSAIDTVD